VGKMERKDRNGQNTEKKGRTGKEQEGTGRNMN
jgi:hypothetical protein